MNKNIKYLLKSLADNILKHLTGYILGAAGFGALVMGYFYDAIGLIKALLSSPTTLSVSLILIALSCLLGYRYGRPKKKAENKIIEEPFLEVGPYKWKTYLYSNGEFHIDPIPYCPAHEMELYEDWPLYFCPMHCGCELSSDTIDTVRNQSQNIIAAHIRKNRT